MMDCWCDGLRVVGVIMVSSVGGCVLCCSLVVVCFLGS